MEISDAQVAQFECDGFLIVDRLLPDADVDNALRAMDRVYSGTYNNDVRPAALRSTVKPFGTQASVRWVLNARALDTQLWNIATHPTLGAAAARLLRTDAVSVIEDQLLDKPNSGVPVNLHQDYSYWLFSTSTNMLTCWIALCDMTAEMGPLELVRGSHRWGRSLRPRELIHGSDKEYSYAMHAALPQGVEPEFASAIVPRGGGVFFHSLTFHGSRGNTTSQYRRAMSLHWAASDCRLDRTKLQNYDHPYLFTGLKHGDPLVNKYIPFAYSAASTPRL